MNREEESRTTFEGTTGTSGPKSWLLDDDDDDDDDEDDDYEKHFDHCGEGEHYKNKKVDGWSRVGE